MIAEETGFTIKLTLTDRCFSIFLEAFGSRLSFNLELTEFRGSFLDPLTGFWWYGGKVVDNGSDLSKIISYNFDKVRSKLRDQTFQKLS